MASMISSIRAGGISDRFAAGAAALFLGVFLVFGAGLANSAALHDTAHDARHALGFPCH